MLPVGTPDWWDSAKKFLLKDEFLSPVVKTYYGESLTGKGDLFATLVNSIIGQ